MEYSVKAIGVDISLPVETGLCCDGAVPPDSDGGPVPRVTRQRDREAELRAAVAAGNPLGYLLVVRRRRINSCSARTIECDPHLPIVSGGHLNICSNIIHFVGDVHVNPAPTARCGVGIERSPLTRWREPVPLVASSTPRRSAGQRLKPPSKGASAARVLAGEGNRMEYGRGGLRTHDLRMSQVRGSAEPREGRGRFQGVTAPNLRTL